MGKFILKHKKIFIAITFIITVLSVYGIFKIKIDSDLLKYMRPNIKEVKEMMYIADKFKSGDVVMVIVKSDSIFSYDFLKKLKNFTREMQDTEGITGVMGIFTVMDISATEDGLHIGNLMESGIPENEDSLQLLKDRILSDSSYSTFISRNGKFTSIIGRVVSGFNKSISAERAKKLAERFFEKNQLYFAGVPFQMFYMERMIKRDLYILIPIALFVLFVILLISFRSIKGIIIPLFTVGLGTVWIMGLHGLLNTPITVVSNTIPVIILAIGSAYSIHIIHRFYEEKEKGMNNHQALGNALTDVGYAVLMAGITTSVGFFTLIFSDIRLLKNFGLFVAIGVVFIIFIALAPGAFMLNIGGQKIKKKELQLKYLPGFILKGRYYIMGLYIMLAIFSIWGITKITRNVNLINYFDRENPVRKGEEIVNKYLGGSVPVYVLIKTDDIKNPAVLWKIWEIEERLKKLPHLKPPGSVVDFFTKMQEVMGGEYTIPLTEADANNLWFLISNQEVSEFFVNSEGTEVLIQGSAESMSTEVNEKLGKEIKSIVDTIPEEYYLVPTEEVIDYTIKRTAKDIAYYTGLKKEKELEKIIKEGLKIRKNFDFAELKQFLLKNDFGYNVSYGRIQRLINSLPGERVNRETFKGTSKKYIPFRGDSLDYEDFLDAAYEVYLKEYAKKRVNIIWEMIKKNIQINPVQTDTVKLKAFLYMPFTEYQLSPFKKAHALKVQFDVSATGFPIVYKMIDNNLIKTQIISLFIALFIVLLLVIAQFRSFKIGFIAIIPLIFTLIIIFGLMGWAKIPLDAVTIIIGAVSVGVGIDYTIHVISRFRRTNNIIDVLTHTGMAVLINALSVGLGLAVLSFSSLIPVRRVGQLLFITMIVSSISALTIIPILLHEKDYLKRKKFKK